MKKINLFEKILFIIQNCSYKGFFVIFSLSALNSILELAGIGLIYPILTYFSGQEIEAFLVNFEYLNFINTDNFLLYALLLFAVIYCCKFLISLIVVILKNKYSYKLFSDLSFKNLEYYLSENYLFHVKTDSSQIIQNLRSETNFFSFGVVLPIIDLIIDSMILISIAIFLLFYNFYISVGVILIFGIFTVFWNSISNKYLFHLGKQRKSFQIKAMNEIQNTLGNIKEIKIFNLKDLFLDKYQKPNLLFSKVGARRDTLMQIPRLILELIIILGIYIMFIFLKKLSLPNEDILVTLGVFAFASIRMLVPISKAIKSVQTIKFNSVVIESIYNELKKYISYRNKKKDKIINKFNKIEFKNLSFKYDESDKILLQNINFQLTKGDRIGVIGKTGSGKTTLINILLGLIQPSSGEIFLNNNKDGITTIYEEIGYVSQNIFLLNESVYYNITFEKDTKNKDQNVNKLLKALDLDQFLNSLEFGLDSVLSEKGGNLSGGQIQRLGIARALYRNPKLLILDEATNSLDSDTENKVIDYIFKLKEIETIVIISHKNTTLKDCNKIYEIKDGNIIEKKNEGY